MSQHEHATSSVLQKLSDVGLTLADARADIRGRKVVDLHGEEIGHVSALFIDTEQRKVRMLEIRAGGFLGVGERHVLLPVDAIANVAKDEVRINETRERVGHSPVYDPSLVEGPTQESWEPFYGYYGLSPYWGTGYLYPGFPMSLHEPTLGDHPPHHRD